MSSATTAVSAADAVTVADTVEKAPRRFPPPCWTQEETLALIEAYRERWYALRRGYLRTADWDAVAAAVTSRCPGAPPAKTSAQCRHKMEKLRQRYRAEKQRSLSFPYPAGRYFSSWFFFENMEAMENGTAPPTSAQKSENSDDGSRLKSFLDQNILKLKLKATNNDGSGADLGFDNGVKGKRFNSGTKMPSQYSPFLDMEVVEKEEDVMPEDEGLVNYGRRKAMNATPQPPPKSKSKRPNKMFNNLDVSGAFHQTRGGLHQEMLPPGLRMKKLGKLDQNMESDNNRINNTTEEFWVKVSNNNNNNNQNSGPPSFRTKYWASIEPSANSRKRERDALEEIVASIKVLGEGFVKMEKAKMEMAREMEAMRMEMEMKRNEMLLESQKQIVDAFLKGLFELKKSKKVKTTTDSATEDP
ncbi:trihelix transcription factor ASIL2-like [Sesamum indicum]|uniref:Trihelix transcription factor ASIL2-like n=1 Tax=Sesamum indicum TaxID=4182 RepID=A0A8M8URG7_SESIN|nr:trihelix transcription factor ASIL2-like [Sesamum indicum]